MSDSSGTSGIPSVEPASGGGSAAGQAYRAQLAREAAASGAAPSFVQQASPGPQPAPFTRASDARTAERKKMAGRARVVLQGAELSLSGKMVDMSLTGACVLIDDAVPIRKMCTLECDIFQNGARHLFTVPALLVYSVLASGHGFKVGFQFGPTSPAALKTISDLLR